MIRLRVDFNELDDDGRVLALARLAPRPLHERERVYMADDEGNRCWGRVACTEGALVHVDADWATWTKLQQPRREPQGWWQSAGTGSTSGFRATIVHGHGPSLWEPPPQNTADAPTVRRLPPLVPNT
jgi:hypothetical protein